MSACQFTLDIAIHPEEALAKAKKAVESQGGSFTGNQDSGSFHLSFFGNTVSGTYTMTDGLLHLMIAEKPMMIPCSAIESYLKNKLS
jgi:hypothetical protein